VSALVLGKLRFCVDPVNGLYASTGANGLFLKTACSAAGAT
jgi:hypothetical protein